MEINPDTYFDAIRRNWWEANRKKYNFGLIVSSVASFFAYIILSFWLIAPNDIHFEITIFTMGFQICGLGVMIGIANLFYGVGSGLDKKFNKNNDEKFRARLFNLGFYFSICVPTIIPILTVVSYYVFYA